MTTVLRVLVSRRVGQALVLVVMASAASAAFKNNAIRIDLHAVNRAHFLGVVEVAAIATATVAASLLRPRFWHWDRLGGMRTRLIASAMAVFGVVVAVLPVVVAGLLAPSHAVWVWSVANALILGSLVITLSALSPPTLAGGLVIAVYFGQGIVYNLETSARTYLPLTGYPGTDGGHWVLAGVSVAVAVAAHGATHGSSSWLHRQGGNE